MAAAYSCYHISQRWQKKKRYASALALGNYKWILNEMKDHSGLLSTCWEYYLLALYHCGQIENFEKLYDTYMNEIHDCATLERYQIYIFHGLIQLMYGKRLPIQMMSRKDIARYAYTKTATYEIYRNVLLGIQEYHQPNKSLSKVYFEKFLNQQLHISKPLVFQLYYLIAHQAINSNHPQEVDYLHRVEACIYDNLSHQLYMNHLQVQANELQKEMRYHNSMDRQQNKNRRASIQEMESRAQASMHQYNQHDQQSRFRSPSQQDDEMMQFSRVSRNSQDYQSDFDALNASVQDGSFNLYEDTSFADSKQYDRFEDEYLSSSAKVDDFDNELDPTWFMRSSRHEEETVQAVPAFEKPLYDVDSRRSDSFAMRQRANPYQQEQVPMEDVLEDINSASFPPQTSDPFPSATAMQRPSGEFDSRSELNSMRRRQTSNVGQERSMDRTAMRSNTRRQAMNHQKDPMMQPSSMHTMREEQLLQTNPRSFQQSETQFNSQSPRSANARINSTQEQNRFQHFEQMNQQQDFPQTNQAVEHPQEFRRSQPGHHRQSLEPQNQGNKRKSKPASVKRTRATIQETDQSMSIFKKFIKTNLTILLLSLINGVVIAFACGSFIYVSFFNKYPIDDKIIPEIILSSLLIAVLMTYLTAGIHTGFTIIKNYIASWSMALKVILSPLLLLTCLLIGAICEIPYLIFNALKSSNTQ